MFRRVRNISRIIVWNNNTGRKISCDTNSKETNRQLCEINELIMWVIENSKFIGHPTTHTRNSWAWIKRYDGWILFSNFGVRLSAFSRKRAKNSVTATDGEFTVTELDGNCQLVNFTYIDREVIISRQEYLSETVGELVELRIGINDHPMSRAFTRVCRVVCVIQHLLGTVQNESITKTGEMQRRGRWRVSRNNGSTKIWSSTCHGRVIRGVTRL